MRYLKYIFPLLLIFSIELTAQYELDFSGYITDMPVYSSSNDKIAELFNMKSEQFINLTRVRLRSALYMWDGARVNAEYEMAGLYTNSEGNMFFNTNANNRRQLIDMNWNPVTEENVTLTHFIDRLYFRQSFDFGNVIIGRQRISWGTGRVWNPVDLFNPISPTAFYKTEKDGADALAATFYMGDFTDLNIVFNPQEKIKQSNYGFRFRTNFNEYDVSMISGYFDKRYIIGFDFAGNLLKAGVRGEGIYSIDDINSSNNFIKFILGIDYQFTPELYALLEYHYNGEGKSDKMFYQFNRLINGEILNLNKNYLAASAMYQVTPLFNVTLSNTTNLNDKSGYVGLIGSYSLTSDTYLNFGGQLFYGNEFSEYWYYPDSFYLKADIYF